MIFGPALTVFVSAIFTGCSGGGDRQLGPTTPSTPAPTATLSLSAPSAHIGLDSVTLSWSSQNATSCSASGAWSGAQASAGSLVIHADSIGSFTYAIRCAGAGGTSAVQSSLLAVTLFSHSACTNEHSERYWLHTADSPIFMGEYMPVNSVGILERDANDHSCMTSTMQVPGVLKSGWTWSDDLPVDTTNAGASIGYPSVGFGADLGWQLGQSTTTAIPVTIAALPDSFIVNFDLGVTTTGSYDVLLDLNLTPTPKPDPCHYTEVDIVTLVHGRSEYEPATPFATFQAGANTFRVTGFSMTRPAPACPNDPTSWNQYVQIHPTIPLSKGSIPLKPVLNALVALGAFDSSTSLLNVWFGAEVGFGGGTATLNSYSIRVR